MLRVRRPSASEIDRVLTEARRTSPTYAEVGATRDAHLPTGYRHDFSERRLGHGNDVFERAVVALRTWQAQVGVGIEVVQHGAQVEEGSTFVLVTRVGGLWATMPCRVVYVDDSPGGFAFGYGTLPGHPECGEVAFRIDRDDSDEVFFRVVSFSRTADPLASLGSPIARRIQKRVTERYLSAVAAASAEPRRVYPQET